MSLPVLKWLPSPNFTQGRVSAVRLVVIHDCQGSYEGSIATFRNKASGVSAHIVLKEDGSEATQMVRFEDKAWHVCSFNSVAIGLEMAGFEARGYVDSEWQSEANMCAYLLHRFKLPVRWAEGGAGAGFCRHYDLGTKGGGHTDPTMDPVLWAAFIKRVETAYADGGFPDEPWGR